MYVCMYVKKLRESAATKNAEAEGPIITPMPLTVQEMMKPVPSAASKHLLASSPVYQGLTVNEKWEVVKEHKRCRKCLRVSHHTNDCTKADGTTCDKCKRNHHRSLHNEKKVDPSKSNLDPDAPAFNNKRSPDQAESKNNSVQGREKRTLTMSRTYLEFVQFRKSESEIAKETSKP